MTLSERTPCARGIPASWALPKETLSLADDRVDLWLVSTVQPARILERLYYILPDGERKTADRQVTSVLRGRSILARGLLRVILGEYCGAPPEVFRFNRSRYGKPMLAGTYNGRCKFNKSHSGDLLLFGFTGMEDIGVDLECVRDNINLDRLSRRQLTPAEYKRFMELPEQERRDLFFRTWARKEAVGKAIGKGLIFQMGSIDVSGIPDEPVRFLRRELPDRDPDNWYIRDIPDICNGVCASVSTYGRVKTINLYHADPEGLFNGDII